MARKYVLGPNAAREFKRLIRGSGEVSRRQNLASAFAFDSEFVFPFTVQWAQSAAEGDGSWIIWLPGDDIVSVDGAAYDPTEELEEVGGDYPEGWYLLDGDALDPDEGGKLYLNMTGGTSHTCEFSASAQTGVEDSHSVAICEASVDADTGARSVKQFVTSSIIIASGDDNDDTRYGADEHSITLLGNESTDPTQIYHTNYFHLYGFGKFQAPGYAAPIGTYMAPTATNVDLDGDAPNFAFICRDGNSSSPDSNTISYRKISFRGSNGSSPFKYVKTTTTDPNTHQPVTLHKLENCKFYWNGELQELPDFDTSALMGGGTVYLRGKQAAPSQSDPDPDWEWSVGSSEQSAPSNGKALNYKLYDFAASKVAVDYRTTFLALEDHTPKAKLEIKKPGSDGGIVLDSSGNVPKLAITDGNGKSVTIDIADISGPNDCPSQNIGVHEIKYIDPSGKGIKAHVLSCADIEIGGGGGGGSSDDGADVIANVVGSDYIEVADKEIEGDGEGEDEDPVIQRQVKAKIKTHSVGGEEADGHALLTSDTEQMITAAKIFAGTNGKIIEIDADKIPDECNGEISIHSLKYKDEDDNLHTFHGLFCGDIDLTKIKLDGKTIEDVDVETTTTETIVTFLYTDETTTEIHIPHGLKGKQGDKGDDGDTPEIWGVKNGQVTTVYADGEVIATINDGHAPQITAEKKDGVTTIYVDGNAVAQIQDGGVGQYDSITCISGIKFEISGGKLKAIISKQTFNVPDTFEMHPVEEVDAQTIDVCDVDELDVVTEEEYSASSHQFTNKRKRVKVIGAATDATGQTPFTATPLSGE